MGGVWCVVRGVVWCGVVWCSVVQCVVWCGVVWRGVVWCGVVWCGVVWGGVVWCGVVWCGVVWCGVVWSSLQTTRKRVIRLFSHPPSHVTSLIFGFCSSYVARRPPLAACRSQSLPLTACRPRVGMHSSLFEIECYV